MFNTRVFQREAKSVSPHRYIPRCRRVHLSQDVLLSVMEPFSLNLVRRTQRLWQCDAQIIDMINHLCVCIAVATGRTEEGMSGQFCLIKTQNTLIPEYRTVCSYLDSYSGPRLVLGKSTSYSYLLLIVTVELTTKR